MKNSEGAAEAGMLCHSFGVVFVVGNTSRGLHPCLCSCQAFGLIGLLAPVLGLLADVGLVAELSHALGLGEELLGLVLASLW